MLTYNFTVKSISGEDLAKFLTIAQELGIQSFVEPIHQPLLVADSSETKDFDA